MDFKMNKENVFEEIWILARSHNMQLTAGRYKK